MAVSKEMEPEKLDLASASPAEYARKEVLRLFPEARSEDGQINFTALRRLLGEEVEVGKERYGLNWPGKTDCFKTIQAVTLATLLPVPAESVNFETTQNLIIEGDNLEVLKLLQKSYLGKVKMIYIDPPYNTGSDFIYPDNYSESLQTYLEYTGQVDSEGRKFGTNTEAEGRFHSRWISMLYPRLYLARNLRRDDGLIFITIDDTELANLRQIMNEIFGEEHFVANIAWEKRYTRSNNAKMFYSLKDSIIVYRKSDALNIMRESRDDESNAIYSNPDDDPRGDWTSSSYVNPATKEQRPNLVYPIINQFTNAPVEHPTHAWKYERAEHLRHVEEKRLWWGKKGEAKYPRLKNFLKEAKEGMVPIDVWTYEDSGTTDEGGLEVKELFGEAVFDNPKPTKLIRRMLGLSTSGDRDGIVLDFFAGSGTTAHAVLLQNNSDSGQRKFILVQLPEPTTRKDYRTIADITKERVRRAIKKLNDGDVGKLDLDDGASQDRGFRVLKLAESNFRVWDSAAMTDVHALDKQLQLHIEHIRPGRSPLDILTEILLKSGFPLVAQVEERHITGKPVFSVASGALLICLERELTLELVRAMADSKPERVVFLDEGFAGNDQLKTNAVQTFKAKGVVFRTV
jgi:adenine-specific DNA-methyltransferase